MIAAVVTDSGSFRLPAIPKSAPLKQSSLFLITSGLVLIATSRKETKMILEDVLSLIGGSDSPDSDYTPIACLLNSGYGCVGYFNSSVNNNLSDTIVLLNMRLVDLRVEEGHSRRGRIADFNDFLQDVVAKHVHSETESDAAENMDGEDGTIPLTAIPVSEIAMLYPVAQIARLLKSAQRVAQSTNGSTPSTEVPTFLDFNNKSIVLKVLRAKIW